MIYRDRGGIVQTAQRVARGEVDPAKLSKTTARKVAHIQAALGGVLSAPPTRRIMGAAPVKLRRARTA